MGHQRLGDIPKTQKWKNVEAKVAGDGQGSPGALFDSDAIRDIASESLPSPVLPGYRPMDCLKGLLSGGRTTNRTRVHIHTLASPAARAFRVPGRLEPGCGFDPNFSGDRRPRRTD